MNNLYFNAVKNKYRFSSKKGNLSVEMLFDLSPVDLDSIYSFLKDQIDEKSKKSLLIQKSDADAELEEKAQIVADIFNYKMEMKEKARKASETRQKKQVILDAIAKKQDEELASMSKEELLKRLAELED